MSWKSAIAIAVYSSLLRLLTPAYLWRIWRRGKVEPMYRHRIGERFGFYDFPDPGAGWIWLHAVSLGETRAAAALIAALRDERPAMRLLLTHGTGTGREAGRELLREGDLQTWLPFDTPGAVRRFFRRFRPAVGVLMETEIWPNLLLEAQVRAVPMVLASARLSERSRRRGARIDWIMRPVAATVALVLAQTEADASRLRNAGARRVEVAGNLKFDLQPDPALIARGRAWRSMLARPVLLAAVTREGEEALLLDIWTKSKQPRPLLVIVPRHPQRFDKVEALIVGAGLTVARRSAWQEQPPPESFAAHDVWLGDSMREMPLYYGLADVALLGGSFAPLGGQNLIEAAACGCPLVMGPHTFNFAEAAALSCAAGAAIRVDDLASAVAAALALLADRHRLRAMHERALGFAAGHSGAARTTARRIGELLAASRAMTGDDGLIPTSRLQ